MVLGHTTAISRVILICPFEKTGRIIIALYGRAGVDKMVSTEYLAKCFTYPHQIWYTEAPGQDKEQVRTG